MQEFHRQHPELVEAERTISAGAEGGEVIVLSSDDNVEGGKDGGKGEEIDINEWRSVVLNDPDDGTGPDPARGTPYLTRKDWIDLHFGRK